MATRTQRTRLSTVTATLSGSGARNRVYWTGTPAPASVSSTQTYTLSFASLLGGSLATSAVITSVGTALPTGWTLNSAARTLSYDGTGSATTVTGIVLRATASGETADSGAFGVTVVSSGTSPGSGTVTTFQVLTSSTPGTYPFTVGHAFASGDVPVSAITDLPNSQVIVKRTWNDGSVKHAIISGRVTFAAGDVNAGGGYIKTVTISRGTPTAGTALTSASIAARATMSTGNINRVTCGALGFVDLSTLLASPVRTFVSGPEMVECHYRGSVGAGDLVVWFHVRLYADNRVWVRAIVENGYLDNGSGALASRTNQSYIPTVTIGGTVVYNNGGATLTHYTNTRWMAEGWIGGNPLITPKHNANYLRDTKMVPNYGWRNPSAAALNALDQNYVPMTRGPHLQAMGGTGEGPQIGLMCNWDALYCTSTDARAYRAVMTGSSAINAYPIIYRSRATNLVIRPTDFPTWTADGPGQGGFTQIGNAVGNWDGAHHPSTGYLAYLISGDYWHYETALHICAMSYLMVTSAGGSGTNRWLGRSQQYRAVAWYTRSIGQAVAIAPNEDIATGGIAADYQALLLRQYSYLQAIKNTAGVTPTGYLWSNETGWNTPSGATTGTVAQFMHDFFMSANGHVSDLQPLNAAGMAVQNDVRNWMYRQITGRFGQLNVLTDYPWTYGGGSYGIKISANTSLSDDAGNPATAATTWYQNNRLIFENTHGITNSGLPATLQGTSAATPNIGPVGYWARAITSLSHAVDHGAPGAQTGFNSFLGASNISQFMNSGFDDGPWFAVLPRNYGLPAWRSGQAVNEWRQISGTSLSLAPATGGITPSFGKQDSWCGWHVDTRTNDVYSVAQGGHGDYLGNEVNRIRLSADAPAWTELVPSSAAGAVTASGGYYSDGKPSSRHGYHTGVFIESINRAMLFPGSGTSTQGFSNAAIQSFNSATGAYDPASVWSGLSYPFGGVFTGSGTYTKHPTTETVYAWIYNTGIFRWNVGTPGSWTQLVGSTGTNAPFYSAAAVDPTRGTNGAGQVLWLGGGDTNGSIRHVLDLGTNTLTQITLTGTNIATQQGMGLVYVQATDRYYACTASAGGSSVYVITPGTWACSLLATTGGTAITSTTGNSAWAPFTKFLYLPLLGGVVFGPRWGSNLWFLRLH